MISYTLTNPNPNITPSSPLRFRSLLRPYSGVRTLSGPVKASRNDPPDIEIKGEVTRVGDGDSVSFEERTVKFSKTGEDFEVCFNKKIRVISKQTSKKMKIQDYIDVIVVEPVKDMFDASASTTDDMKDVWKTQDFHLGIPYCGMLSFGGVFSFMITGSICATRLNIILGGMFLALSIIGLRSLKEGNSSAIAVTGQAAIVAVLFVRQACVMFMKPRFTSCIVTLLSGVVLALYIKRIAFLMEQAKGEPSMGTATNN